MDWCGLHFRFGRVAKTIVAVMVLTSVAVCAEKPEIEVGVRQNEIFAGDSIDFQIEIRNVKNPVAPDLTELREQFDVVPNGDESRNQSSVFIVNGQVTKQNVFGHVYHFRLTPKATGDLTIPSVKVMIDGKTLTSKELSVRVIEAEKQDIVLIEVETSHERVYPTQPFTVTARVLVRPLPNDAGRDPLTPVRTQPPHLQLNWVDAIPGLSTDDKAKWLQPLLSDDSVGLTLNDVATRSNSLFDMGSRLAVLSLYKGREAREGANGEQIRYFVYELSRTFTAEKPGEYSFGPAFIKGTFVSGAEKREYTGRRLVAIAPAKTVEVREVPSPRPSNFCGGIGTYRVSATANPTKLRVGDPLTLVINIERGPQSGSLELVSAPDLSAVTELMNDFDLIDKNPTGRVEDSVKKFSYGLRPKRTGVEIPPLTISTFDTDREQFIETQTSAISLDVSEAARVTAGDLIGSMPAAQQSTIKSRSQGIFQNITDPAELKDERVDVAMWSKAAAGIWAAALVLVSAIKVYRHRSSDPRWVRRQQARQAATRQLSLARTSLSAGDRKQALFQVRSAIVGLVADLQDRIASGLTTADVLQALMTANVSVDDRAAVQNLLESIESAEYGGADAIDPDAAIQTAGVLINRIAPLLERGAAT